MTAKNSPEDIVNCRGLIVKLYLRSLKTRIGAVVTANSTHVDLLAKSGRFSRVPFSMIEEWKVMGEGPL